MTTLVVGLGASDRGDDAAGLLVADQLSRRRLADVTVRRLEGSPLALLSWWCATDAVIVVDALCGVGPPGAVRRFDALARPLPGARGAGSHDASLAAAIGLADALDRLPRSLIVYGIVGGRFGFGDRPQPAVLAAVSATAVRIATELS